MIIKELITSCLQRNRLSEKRLYERYVTVMARLCQRYIREDAEAQDALIEGFTKVFNKLSTFEYRGEQSLEIWIRRIMINECLMRLRKHKRLLLTTSEAEEESLPIHTDSSAKEIMQLMHHLPTGYRTILNLNVIDGYSHKEIATLLGITESASRSQLTHARSKLKELLKTHGWNGMIK
ncbi:RNA polymerase sigma-70 factor, ECF subfamily [Chitinophaga sp. YR627]|uniref:RNA polymerase sigma factor n=1 Tax=Chitinophaga sp. YR627 TaxID=1881041 RepID=UPI0008EDD20C|nr:sigma-70 family RNA polymerase sigma factor [Chitinophaga sp. YR627]SFN32488.1 RNA polymerase sigma-70 factor, ECF subfamily [Chitinophaga sp. YR627]